MENIKFSLNTYDWISTLRNWVILNTAMLIANWNVITNMFANWSFNWIEVRQMAVLSISSLILFTLKRYVMGEKKV